MSPYRKLPVTVDAEQYSAERHATEGYLPKGVTRRVLTGEDGEQYEGKPCVRTIHGEQMIILEDGDWVVMEKDGVHAYPVKPDVFALTFEEVDEEGFSKRDLGLRRCELCERWEREDEEGAGWCRDEDDVNICPECASGVGGSEPDAP